MARVIGAGFARWEPQARNLRPPKHPPTELMEARHTDPFGTERFGSWDTETHLYWITRLAALTDPSSSLGAIEVNEETLAQSLAILDGVRSWCSRPSPRATSRSRTSRRARTDSSRTRTAGACSR